MSKDWAESLADAIANDPYQGERSIDTIKERCAEINADHEYAERRLAAELIELVGEEVVPHKIDFVLWAAECSWNNQADVEAFLESRED